MLSEKSFQSQVIEMARLLGWWCYHTYDSRRCVAGFPDLHLSHAQKKRVVFAELKTDKGRLSAYQSAWIAHLREAGAEVYVWRPSDWPAIEEALR